MSKRKIIEQTEIHKGGGNVYRDLGYPDADEMLVKAQLVAKISGIIRSQELTQVEAARILGVSIDAGLEFMRKQMIDNGDQPCDFADASLLYAAWSAKLRDVWTIDSDFTVYRLPDRSRFKVNPSR